MSFNLDYSQYREYGNTAESNKYEEILPTKKRYTIVNEALERLGTDAITKRRSIEANVRMREGFMGSIRVDLVPKEVANTAIGLQKGNYFVTSDSVLGVFTAHWNGHKWTFPAQKYGVKVKCTLQKV